MTMEARHKRMLEETLKLPGNDNCADCHAPAPRWASVNLGIFLCVGCASVHRKMGTHKSRVKSVTLDTWTREQIVHMREVGNTVSNSTFNPNEALHPPPPSYGHDERDSEIERYIRKKYEMGVFKVGSKPSSSASYEPTSLNRARERDGRIPFGSTTATGSNADSRNPELNDIISFNKQEYNSNYRDRDLPALPLSSGSTGSAPRSRPTANRSVPAPWATPSTNAGTPPPVSTHTQPQTHTYAQPQQVNMTKTKDANLIDFSAAQTSNATLPLQINMTSNIPQQSFQSQNGYLSTPTPQQQQQQQYGYVNGFNMSSPPTNIQSHAQGFTNSSNNNAFGTSPQFGANSNSNYQAQQTNFGSSLSPQPNFTQQMGAQNGNGGFTRQGPGPLTPSSTPSPAFSSSPSFSNPQIHQSVPQFQQQYNSTPSFGQSQSSQFAQQPSFGQQHQYGQNHQQQPAFMSPSMSVPQQQNQWGVQQLQQQHQQQNNGYLPAQQMQMPMQMQNGMTMQGMGMGY
ncbi:uncharacterized protein I303_108053 [Kwoniella dejecticola CBS 10117]|uniref:Arf-GAP domain-containing protein n=1 Tax=Kwoniella dejecticola CBS 10117 TaxID=1296121 RepID=A0A1A5ZWE2_9TREE|nr:uncharacterized protein I303_08044 [Kwoniella dejecticola CBS 10117]OBR82130.1 hypothetical protein I303_08044 [Kwoniella dejecticola CBS 10117]